MAIRKPRSTTRSSADNTIDRKRSKEFSGIIKLWVLRILVPLEGWRELDGSTRTRVLEGLGLHRLTGKDNEKYGDVQPSYIRKVRAALEALHAEAEINLTEARVPVQLSNAVARLSTVVGLSAIDCRLLEFSVLLHTERVLDDVADCLGRSLSAMQAIEVLSDILNLPEGQVRKAFQPSSLLTSSGLLSFDRSGTHSLRNKLNLLTSSFAERMLLADGDPVSMLQDIVTPSPPSRLSLADYPHLAESLQVLIPYLQRSLKAGRHGVNVFLYGPPGTGKTQLAMVLAQELSSSLFQVSTQDEDGDPACGERRLRSYRAAQSFLGQRCGLLLFDEADDVFNDAGEFFGRKSTAQTKKGWLNSLLEENPVPTIWIANSIGGIDPAFIRRFDMALELPVPPRSQREKIIRSNCKQLLAEDAIKRFSASERLAPAVVARAATVINVVRDILTREEAPKAMEMLINKSLAAQRLPGLSKSDATLQALTFDPSLINAQTDLVEVAQGLRETRTGRLCLYGPPGTGKTAFGCWLAEQIGIPLHTKRASDLLSMYVGGTEENIAACFVQAEREGALLMLDEVDSFLQDRAGASRSWEVTQVNELLTQMESYQGVFVASTNLVNSLDQASLRRFDLKLKFDHMTHDQAWSLFMRKCVELGFGAVQSGLRQRVRQLKCLTPGDFAAVTRRNRFSRLRSAEELVAALEAECAVKMDKGTRTVGF